MHVCACVLVCICIPQYNSLAVPSLMSAGLKLMYDSHSISQLSVLLFNVLRKKGFLQGRAVLRTVVSVCYYAEPPTNSSMSLFFSPSVVFWEQAVAFLRCYHC